MSIQMMNNKIKFIFNKKKNDPHFRISYLIELEKMNEFNLVI